jgi:hypothetical protein
MECLKRRKQHQKGVNTFGLSDPNGGNNTRKVLTSLDGVSQTEETIREEGVNTFRWSDPNGGNNTRKVLTPPKGE